MKVLIRCCSSSSLFLMNIKSDSLIIGLDQEGPVHAWEWNPKGENFAVIYGFMPGKTVIFNKKGDLVHTFGESLLVHDLTINANRFLHSGVFDVNFLKFYIQGEESFERDSLSFRDGFVEKRIPRMRNPPM